MQKKIKGKLLAYYYRYQLLRKLSTLKFSRKKPNLILFQTPVHSNIGDHAIVQAQLEFLAKQLPEHHIIEINQSLMQYFIRKRKHKVKSSDMIVIHGGGNFGNEYMYEEQLRRLVIESFPNNKIISFPQTIYYSNDAAGQHELAVTKGCIGKHKALTLVAREKVSFELMKTYFPDLNVVLSPDIVLSMANRSVNKERKGALMVLREDAEKILTTHQHEELTAIIEERFSDITYSDMHHSAKISTSTDRDSVLDFKLNQFQTSELVITDRLHGMVFAAITGTPCIAFSNYNQKVEGTYQWIKELKYIRFVSPEAPIGAIVDELLAKYPSNHFPAENYSAYFDHLIVCLND